MAVDEVMTPEEASGPFVNPWPALLSGLGVMALDVLLSPVLSGPLFFVRILLVVGGALAAGVAVAIRPRSAAVLGTAALTALLASVAVLPKVGARDEAYFQWDSAVTLFRVAAAVAAVAAILVVSPRPVRRAVVSFLIVFHFGGILTAVTSTSPQPWLSGQIWTYVYRPYLYFMYLNNAYHFYSPEPGPASLLWFRVEYQKDQDGNKHWRWIKVPDLDENGNAVPWRPKVEYTRRLSLAESTNQQVTNVPELVLNQFVYRRNARKDDIPFHPEIPIVAQFRPPNTFSQHWIAAYARHVAHFYPHPDGHPDLGAEGVKVYRVLHRLPNADDCARETDFYDETTYWPYYQGEFDKEGNLKLFPQIDRNGEPQRGPDGQPILDTDPLLYWLIPIARFPKRARAIDQFPFRVSVENSGSTVINTPRTRQSEEDFEVRNYLKIHAGDEEGGK
jgi:hypothetical protein